VNTQYNKTNLNLHKPFRKIVENAGLVTGPTLFQNLRTSRATELENEFGTHKSTQWCGHTEKIAEAHYWMVTADDVMKAAAYVYDAAGRCKPRKCIENDARSRLRK